MNWVLDALFYRLRNCGPWRDLPPQHGPWQTIYGWHRTFARAGLWLTLLKGFARKVGSRVVLVDGLMWWHTKARPIRRAELRLRRWEKHAGGRNSKVMALTDRKGRLMNFIVVEGQCYEGKHVRALLPKWQKWKVVGDKGFDSDKLRGELERLGHVTCFPGKKKRTRKVFYSKELYRVRYRVANFFCRIKRWA